MQELTASQLREWKLKKLREVDLVCPLCKRPFSSFDESNIVVDHDHVTQVVRGLLCRRCNGMEGKALELMRRLSKDGSLMARLELLASFMKAIYRSPNPRPPASSLLNIAKKALGSDDKTRALQWLSSIGKYWMYHNVPRTNYIYGRKKK